MSLKASCAARTHINDIRPIVEISQKVGIEIEVMAFMGSSPIRQYAENWDLDRMLQMSSEAITFASENNVPVTFVTEDTVRSRPDTLETLFRNAIECGARRLCLCDTCGHATPDGVRSLVRFSQRIIEDMGMAEEVFLDWHGHNDRGLALTNAIRALEAGVDRLHGTALGIGERVGNTMMDQLLLNLKLLGVIDNDLTNLLAYCHAVSEATRWAIPKNYPLAGSDAFRTATGVHASAIIKAEKKGDQWLADRIYSGVPAGEFGKRQEIEIGHMSGASNVQYWLTHRNIEPAPALIEAILIKAKATNRTLVEEEVMTVVRKLQI
jgi:2-isopropylmalate synthase